MFFLKRLKNLFSYGGEFPLIFAFTYNCLVYGICSMLTRNTDLHSLALPADNAVPFLPWTIIIYFTCYIFWVVNYILIYGRSKEQAYRFLLADIASRTVCLMCFLLWPTTIERPEINTDGFFESLVRFLYAVDAPVNLFPSIHCLCSWYCFIGICKDREIPLEYRIFSLCYAIAVFISTLTTKQHVIVDVAAGIILAQLTYDISMKTEGWRQLEKIFDKIIEKFKPN